VTFDDWDACVANGDCPPAPDSGWGRGRRPAINISWYDAQLYVAWLSKMTGKPYRLLSEAEWEYAARAGTQTAYSWGDEIGENNANCVTCGSQWDRRYQSAPVGSFAANAFGLYDMAGNVWEWVEDCLQSNYERAPDDGSASLADSDCSRRRARGGSWFEEPVDLRSAVRHSGAPDNRLNAFGFRIGRTLTP
jgi:formylglycine-generating enzyme required for sulfatase activity